MLQKTTKNIYSLPIILIYQIANSQSQRIQVLCIRNDAVDNESTPVAESTDGCKQECKKISIFDVSQLAFSKKIRTRLKWAKERRKEWFGPVHCKSRIKGSRGSFNHWLGVGRGGEKAGKVQTYPNWGSGQKVGRAMRGWVAHISTIKLLTPKIINALLKQFNQFKSYICHT